MVAEVDAAAELFAALFPFACRDVQIGASEGLLTAQRRAALDKQPGRRMAVMANSVVALLGAVPPVLLFGGAALLFLVNGAVFANLLPRLPQIKDAFELSNSVYGFVVIAFPLGSLLAGTAPAPIMRRWGSGRTAVMGSVAIALMILLAGVSRSSKTPTSIYLANRGYKVANIPIVVESPPPAILFNLKHPLVVGLTTSADRLIAIRRNRLLSLNQATETSYVEQEAVQRELTYARRLFGDHGWPVIDVTRRSIEETAAAIISLCNERAGTGRVTTE